jgi:hypothetical protein
MRSYASASWAVEERECRNKSPRSKQARQCLVENSFSATDMLCRAAKWLERCCAGLACEESGECTPTTCELDRNGEAGLRRSAHLLGKAICSCLDKVLL